MSRTDLGRTALFAGAFARRPGSLSRAATGGSRAQRSLDGVAAGHIIASEERFGREHTPLFIVEIGLTLLTHTTFFTSPIFVLQKWRASGPGGG